MAQFYSCRGNGGTTFMSVWEFIHLCHECKCVHARALQGMRHDVLLLTPARRLVDKTLSITIIDEIFNRVNINEAHALRRLPPHSLTRTRHRFGTRMPSRAIPTRSATT